MLIPRPDAVCQTPALRFRVSLCVSLRPRVYTLLGAQPGTSPVPAQAPLARLRGKTRWQMLIKAADRKNLRRMLSQLLDQMDYFKSKTRFHGVRINADIDPQNLL